MKLQYRSLPAAAAWRVAFRRKFVPMGGRPVATVAAVAILFEATDDLTTLYELSLPIFTRPKTVATVNRRTWPEQMAVT